jgi:hypothetical protein
MLDLKLYYRAIVITPAWYCWYRDRQVNQWNRNENPEINTHTYGHFFFFFKLMKPEVHPGKNFNKWCWSNWIATCRRMKIDNLIT